jgi:hypothetical protein
LPIYLGENMQAKTKLREVKSTLWTLIDIIQYGRYKAKYKLNHKLVDEIKFNEYLPCSDIEVKQFIEKIESKIDKFELIVSNIDRSGDQIKILPVIMKAIKLIDNIYHIELVGHDFRKVYLYYS